ncbi:unnamed protein product [Effrenium voratum]|uniref:tRNA (guanine(46)-N(7))-methyltransferase n=1 Tax=Effrenium voratum TaxID=2562239 RepID=A0AA36HPY4_9DINO|nr:unnamed protein product [Effrenium voratum]
MSPDGIAQAMNRNWVLGGWDAPWVGCFAPRSRHALGLVEHAKLPGRAELIALSSALMSFFFEGRQMRAWEVLWHPFAVELEAVVASSPAALRQLLDAVVRNRRPLNGVNLATILFKAAKMDATEVYSPASLAYLAKQMRGQTMDGRQLASSLYGLQGLGAFPMAELEELVCSLAVQAERLEEELSGQAVSLALYGLQSLEDESGQNLAVRRLLRALARRLSRGSRGSLTAQGVGSVYGLQGLSSSPELRELLVALRPLVEAAPLDSQAIGNALYGLQSMNSDSREVCQFLETFAIKLRGFDQKLNEQEASNAVYGLQFMDPELPCVRELLAAIARASAIRSESRESRSGPGPAGPGRAGRAARHPVDQRLSKLRPGWRAELRRFLARACGACGACRVLDVGCDLGGFVRGVARARPDALVLGLEARPHAVAFARAKAEAQGLRNAAFLQGNAKLDLEHVLTELSQVEAVTINFPDPHLLNREQRLVSGHFVRLLAEHLQSGGEVLFQSDVSLLVEEAKAAFMLGGCFLDCPWVPQPGLCPDRARSGSAPIRLACLPGKASEKQRLASRTSTARRG